MRRIAFAAAAALAAASPALADKLTKAQQRAVAASPADVAASAEVIDDPFSPALVVTTRPFYVERSMWKLTDADEFLQAVIDRKTGATVYSIYVTREYTSDTWIAFSRLGYIAGGSPKQVDLAAVKGDVPYCLGASCRLSESAVAIIPEADLREAAVGAVAGAPQPWPFRLYGDGAVFDRGFLKTEIAGLFLAVDRERARLALKK